MRRRRESDDDDEELHLQVVMIEFQFVAHRHQILNHATSRSDDFSIGLHQISR